VSQPTVKWVPGLSWG